MRFEDALDWYANNHRTAEDVARATGVSEASQRLLQKHKIFSPVPQAGRTSKRLLFNHTLLRLAIAGEMNRSGIPLIPASKIIHADLWLEDFQIPGVDPFQMFFEWDAKRQRYARSKSAKGDPDGFYDRKRPVTAHKHDQFIEIVDNRFVFSKPFTDKVGHVFGELTSDKDDFIVWYGHAFDHIVEGKKLRPTLIDDSGLWSGLRSKRPSAADTNAAEFAQQNPTSKLSVNAGMALRAALRRLLHIDGRAED
jgi:hypothetical protein